MLGPALFARLYGVAEADVLFTPYPAGRAFEATLPRLHRLAQGGHGPQRRRPGRRATREQDAERIRLHLR